MSELQQLELALRQTARWRRWHRTWRGLWLGLFVGACAWLLALGLYKALPLPAWLPPAGGLLLALAAVTGGCIGGWRRASLLATARWVDAQKHLEERVSTALELAAAGGSADWVRLLTHDATRHVQKLQPRQLLPLRLPAISRWTLLVLAVAGGLGFVPEYRTQGYLQQRQDAENIQQVGQQLAEMIRHTIVEKPPALPPVQQALETAAHTGELLAKAPMTRSEALRDLANVSDQVARQMQELSQNPALQRLADAARNPGSEGPTAADLQKKMADLQQALGRTSQDPKQLGALQQRMEALKQQAARAAGKDGALGQADRSQLAGELNQLAEAAAALGASLPGLESAIAALTAGQTDLFLRDLQTALNDLERLKQTAQALQQCQQQSEQLGKDLPEQLDKAQAQAAQGTLQRMIDQLQSGQTSAGQLQKMQEEVNRSIQPASPYGQMGEHLKKAVENLQQARNQAAAGNLADAAKELEKLRQQMADAQGLGATLDALQRAQSAIAMGKSWEDLAGQCQACNGKGCSQCQGRGRNLSWGHGGRPGMGVGTWADESGWRQFDNVPWGQPFDPSNVQRPDLAPRPPADRPDDLPPGLLPTKIPGKFQAGESMPSITLKDLSIQGTSTVEYEQAVSAAQSEAESALEQDQVPRAYQQAVRNYFDDLKKKR